MVIKCNIAGTLDLNNLNLKLNGGQIIDLHNIFSPSIVKREMSPPNGCIYQAFQEGWISNIDYNSSEYKAYANNIKREIELKIKEEINQNMRRILIEYYKKKSSDKIKFIRSLNYSYYDFLIEIKKNEKDQSVLYALYKRLGDFAERKTQEGFVLI